MLLAGFILAALIGLSLGTLGGGGSTLTVPIFVYVMGFEAKRAIAMSFPVVGGTSLVGALSHWRHGNVRWRTALVFGIVAMVGAFGSAHLIAPRLTGETQLLLLGGVMLVAAVSMFRNAGGRKVPDAEAPASLSLPLLMLTALGVGMLTGILGIGGGFLIVPALALLARVPIKEAVGTSLVIISMNTGSAYLGYVGKVDIPWGVVLAFTAIAILGILAGTRLVRAATPAQLKRAFAIFLLAVGGFVFYENRAVFERTSPSSAVEQAH
jgi:uncharacterized membrane protein YfcA